MKRVQVFDVSVDKDEALWNTIRRLYPKELAALPNDTSPYVSYFGAAGSLTAIVTFVFPKSSEDAEFEYADGVWKRTRDWND
ncbi:hypothetical protein RI103_34985 [Paraburkholderia sp. FT54]|uniref:hypothetical protein n=1 Tax=Paraburkholderia sp. FT54 TaxID=3074437 RepID=UPI002877769B|nr:hypothetical protein [Paraburkholderia sp. FT54]WNC94380.1 hypothetical protein RI103_34985 [Paraburkholderia sp. FT54]